METTSLLFYTLMYICLKNENLEYSKFGRCLQFRKLKIDIIVFSFKKVNTCCIHYSPFKSLYFLLIFHESITFGIYMCICLSVKLKIQITLISTDFLISIVFAYIFACFICLHIFVIALLIWLQKIHFQVMIDIL